MDAPSNLEVDHRDCDGLNNRRSNLRLATMVQNMLNQGCRRDNASGFKGVTWDKGRSKWRAQIALNKKRHYLGLFDEPEAAHAAYAEASVKFHGEFGRVE